MEITNTTERSGPAREAHEAVCNTVFDRVTNRLQGKWRGMTFDAPSRGVLQADAGRTVFVCAVTGWATAWRDTEDMPGILRENVFKDLHQSVSCVRDAFESPFRGRHSGRAVWRDGIYARRITFEITIDARGDT